MRPKDGDSLADRGDQQQGCLFAQQHTDLLRNVRVMTFNHGGAGRSWGLFSGGKDLDRVSKHLGKAVRRRYPLWRHADDMQLSL
jgi:hypothetical protein